MRSTLFALALASLACGASQARAQSLPADPVPDDAPHQPQQYELLEPDGLSLGVAVLSSRGIRLGEGNRTLLVPVLGYEGDRLFLRGLSGGVHLYKRDGLEVNLLAAARLDGWDARDLDASRLAARGIERGSLRDRDHGAELGLGLAWRGSAGRLGLEARTDVGNASDGYELELGYAFAVPAGKGLLAPGVAVSYWSPQLTDYYYGSLAGEEAAGVPRTRPGGAVVPSASVAYLRALPGRWRVFGVLDYQWLPGNVRDSPLVENRRGVPSLFIGVSRSFGAAR